MARPRSTIRPTCTRAAASHHAAAHVEIMEVFFPSARNGTEDRDFEAHTAKAGLIELRRHVDTGACLIIPYSLDDGIEVRAPGTEAQAQIIADLTQQRDQLTAALEAWSTAYTRGELTRR